MSSSDLVYMQIGLDPVSQGGIASVPAQSFSLRTEWPTIWLIVLDFMGKRDTDGDIKNI